LVENTRFDSFIIFEKTLGCCDKAGESSDVVSVGVSTADDFEIGVLGVVSAALEVIWPISFSRSFGSIFSSFPAKHLSK
jgi:hypothetical protein